MERINAILEREEEVLETLLFKLVATRLLLENGELRFLSRATREVERAGCRPSWCLLWWRLVSAQESAGPGSMGSIGRELVHRQTKCHKDNDNMSRSF